MTTTAGFIREGAYDSKYADAENVLNGLYDNDGFKDDAFLPVIYELDNRDEWTDETKWKKANPNLGMKNKIQVISSVTKNKQTSVNIHYTTPDNENISKYGILQEIIEIDSDKTKSSEQIAKNKLKELNTIKEEIKLTILSDYKAQKGVITQIVNNSLGLDGIYLIKSSSHSIQGTKETVNINIKNYEL